MWVGVVVNQLEVQVTKGKEVFYVRVDLHRRQRARFACQLLSSLVDVIHVEVHIAKSVDEITGFEVAHLRHHHGK